MAGLWKKVVITTPINVGVRNLRMFVGLSNYLKSHLSRYHLNPLTTIGGLASSLKKFWSPFFFGSGSDINTTPRNKGL